MVEVTGQTAPAPTGGRWRRLLSRPSVNRRLTRAIRPFAPALSQDALLRVPVVGVVDFAAPGTGGLLMENDGTDPIASMLFWRGADGWEPVTVSIFSTLVHPGSVVVDVGANTGLFSLVAARRHPTVRVHAIEPVSRVFDRLDGNVRLNRLANVTTHRLALSDAAGPRPIYVPRRDTVPMMASLLWGWSPDVDIEWVDCSTLDGFFDAVGLDRVDVVKVDAEGSEEAVLRGARATLARHRPHVICEVLARRDAGEGLTAMLAADGYRFFALGRHGLEPRSRIEGGIDDDESHNFLCVHGSRIDELEAAGAG